MGAAIVCALDASLRYGTAALLSVSNSTTLSGRLFGEVFALYRDNSNVLRDLQLVMFAGMVMFGAAWTLRVNEHVRVDVAYSSMPKKARYWIDLIGGVLFLVPMCVLMIWLSWPWFLEAWTSGEMSQNAGGLPRWPIKICLPIGFSLLLLQGLAEIARDLRAIVTGNPRGDIYVRPQQ